MSPQAQQMAIHEACGWILVEDGAQRLVYHQDSWNWVAKTTYWFHLVRETAMPTDELPDYLNDLNAMREAETILTGRREAPPTKQVATFYMTLTDVCYPTLAIFATPAQRAESLLRTLNLWDDSK